ncbi:hypothetical protein L484_015368 [Morus notabilis]|uniref:Uncharacterized protein n=1 Tax=Morus notabilis TaxID=981085 RepID=W9RML6_9ROSA|nr:hypothetical protein L484_015368 [Morus notabilis]
MICYSRSCESNGDNLPVSETCGDAAREVVLAEIIGADGKIFAPESVEGDWVFETTGESLTLICIVQFVDVVVNLLLLLLRSPPIDDCVKINMDAAFKNGEARLMWTNCTPNEKRSIVDEPPNQRFVHHSPSPISANAELRSSSYALHHWE